MRIGQVRALLLAAALVAGAAAPLAAQDDAGEPAPAVPAMPEMPAPGPIVLLDAPEAVIEMFGTDPLDPTEEFCLADGEAAVLASDRVTFALEGETCVTLAAAEDRAYRAERREIDPEFARQEAYAAAVREQSERRSRMESEMPVRSAAPRVRAGAVRGTADTTPRPVMFRVYSGSPAVLERLPRGTLVQRETAICLKQGEQVTINASTGQSVTYRGPGCLNRQARPTRNNIGGFTFG